MDVVKINIFLRFEMTTSNPINYQITYGSTWGGQSNSGGWNVPPIMVTSRSIMFLEG